MEADDEVDSVALDVADEGLVAARGHGHRLRDARELEPLEEADGEVAVGGRGMCYKTLIYSSLARSLLIIFLVPTKNNSPLLKKYFFIL